MWKLQATTPKESCRSIEMLQAVAITAALERNVGKILSRRNEWHERDAMLTQEGDGQKMCILYLLN